MKLYRIVLTTVILIIGFMMPTASSAQEDNLIFDMNFTNVTDTAGNWNITRVGNDGSTDNGIFTAAKGTDSGSRWDITLKDGKSLNLHDDSIENITYEVTFKTTGVTSGRYVGLFGQKFFTKGEPNGIKATDGNDEPDFNGAFHMQLQPNTEGYHYLQLKLGDAGGTAYLFNGAGSGSMKFSVNKWYQLVVVVEKDTTTHKAIVTVYNRDMETGALVEETKELPYCDNPYLSDLHPLIFGRLYRGANFYGTSTSPQYDGSTYLRDVVFESTKIYGKKLTEAEMELDYYAAAHHIGIDMPTASISQQNDVSPDTENIILAFTDDIDESTLKNIEIYDNENNNIKFSCTVDASSKKTVYLNLHDYLAFDTEYIVDVKGVKTLTNKPVLEKLKFLTQKNSVYPISELKIVNSADKQTASVDLKNTGSGEKKILMLIVAYDSKGVAINSGYLTDTLSAGGEDTFSVSMPADSKIANIKAFVFDEVNDGNAIISVSPIISTAQSK